MKQGDTSAILRVSGMTCHSCEERVEKALMRIPGVLSAQARQSRGQVETSWDPEILRADRVLKTMGEAIGAAGYILKGEAMPGGKTSRVSIFAIAALMIAGFLLMNSQGWFNFFPRIDITLSLGMIFIAGLLTSVHCVAMCGGIAISQQAPRQDGLIKATIAGDSPSPSTTAPSRIQASLRGLQYHAGRIVSYTLLGGIVGAAGSVISFSPLTRGILAGIAGLFMVGIGLRMLGLLPRITRFGGLRFSRFVPSGFITALRKRGPFFVGLLNGFMPCGPLQTMQLYALGTGSAVTGALSMFLFSLGTVPLMFLFGAVSNFFSLKWQHRLVRASAVLVVFFGILMAGRALDLSGASGMLQTMASRIFGSFASVQTASGSGGTESQSGQAGSGSTAGSASPEGSGSNGSTAIASIKDGIQYVSFDLEPDAYAPLTVQKGIPVRWTINASPENLNGCNGEIEVPQLGIKKKLVAGANLIEFTPDSSGIISYTCWMGMISSSITVVDKLADRRPDLSMASGAATGPDRQSGIAPAGPAAQAGLPGSGGCCSTGNAPAFAGGAIPSDRIQTARFITQGGKQIQEATVTVSESGYEPAVLVLQKGIPARIRFVAAKLDSCNRIVNFPDYRGGLDLGKGELATPLIPVTQDFVFECGMGMLHGYVRVVDDAAKANPEEIRRVVKAWKPSLISPSGGCCGGG